MNTNTLKALRTLIQSQLKGAPQVEALKNIDELIKASEQELEYAKSTIEDATNITSAAAEQINRNMVDIKNDYNAQIKVLGTLRDKLAELKSQQRENNEEDAEAIRLMQEQIRLNEVDADNYKKRMQVEKANLKLMESTNKFLKDKIGLGYELEDSFVGSLVASDDALGMIKNSVLENLKPQKLLASALMQVQKATIDFAKAQDTAFAATANQTATTGEYNDLLTDVAKENATYNVSLKESQEAITGLHTTMSMFSEMTGEQKEELVTLNAQLSALGVNGADAAKTTDVLVQSLGMSTGQSVEASKELVALGTALKIPADVINKDFADASTQLAKYGTDMVDVFKDLQGAAKATGISFNSLMTITSQFDTFEGAATSAGKLNAILGGGVINSMDLLNGTEEERVRLLIQSIQASGKSFENMNKFERMAIANAAGIQDMNEANKLFSQSLSAYDMQVAKAGDAEAAQAKMNERASAAISVQEKLARIGEAFAISLGPVITAVSVAADAILSLSEMMGGYLFPALTIGIGLVYSIRGAYMAYNAVQAIGGTIAAANAVKEGVLASARAFLTGVTTTQNIVESQSIPIKNASTASNAGLGSSLIALGAAGAIAAPGLLALGTALSTVLIPIAAVILSVALLVASVALLIFAMIKLTTEVGAGALIQTSMAFLAFAQTISSGLAVVAAALISYITTLGVVTALSGLYVGIIGISFLAMSYAVAALAMSLSLLPEKKMIAIGVASEGIAKVMDASVKLTPEAVAHTKEIVSAAADYVKVQAEMLSPDMDSFVQALRGAFGGGGSGGGQDVVLVLNDREFARAVNVALNRSNNLNID